MHRPGVAASKTGLAPTRRAVRAARRTGPGRTSPACPARESRSAGYGRRAAYLGSGSFGAGRPTIAGLPVGRAGRRGPDGDDIGGQGTPGAGGLRRWTGSEVPSAPRPTPSPRSSCWRPRRTALRVPCLLGGRDQRLQRRDGGRRLVEGGPVLGRQRRHLDHRWGDRERRGVRLRRTRPGARPGRTPARPPRSPCSHRRRAEPSAGRSHSRPRRSVKSAWASRVSSGYA